MPDRVLSSSVSADLATPPWVKEAAVSSLTAPRLLSPEASAALTARLLASLKAHEKDTMEEQQKILAEGHYQMLPVVQFLRRSAAASFASPVPGSLAAAAAAYLDCLPQAKEWSERYAAQTVEEYKR